MLYFAYGSNMSHARLRARVPSAVPVGIATLFEHQLRFHQKSKDLSTKCNAFHTGRADDFVIGVLFRFDPSERPALDQAEGLGYSYDVKNVELIDGNGQPVHAFTYYGLRVEEDGPPYDWYKEHVLRGALDANFPEDYVVSIRNVVSKPAPNPDDAEKELSIYR